MYEYKVKVYIDFAFDPTKTKVAHGLLGDGNRIPPKAAIVYKIKVVDNQYKN